MLSPDPEIPWGVYTDANDNTPGGIPEALGIDRGIGLLLPCNVVVRAAGDGTVVEALDPQVMVTLTGRPELKPVADEVGRRLASALADLIR